jgi:hypothetical protein
MIHTPSAQEGREEAQRAGQLLKAHGFEFDVVYTSWLSRAIETAWVRTIYAIVTCYCSGISWCLRFCLDPLYYIYCIIS